MIIIFTKKSTPTLTFRSSPRSSQISLLPSLRSCFRLHHRPASSFCLSIRPSLRFCCHLFYRPCFLLWCPRFELLLSFPTSFRPWCPRLVLRHCPAAVAAACPLAAELAPRLVAAVLAAVPPVAVHLASAVRPLSVVRRLLFLCLFVEQGVSLVRLVWSKTWLGSV